MVVQRQNPAYRLAPPTRRLMRRIPGAPGVGPVLKQLRNEKGPGWGLFHCCRTARGPNTWGLARLSACWKTLVCPHVKKESEAQAGWALCAGQTLCAGPTPGVLRDFQPAGRHLSVPMPKGSRGRRLAGCGRARQTRRAGPAPGALRDFQPAGRQLSVPAQMKGWGARRGT